MMVMMWAAEWPLAQFTSTGEANGSSNPFMDYHLIYALAAIVLAVIGAGNYFGLGHWWAGVTAATAGCAEQIRGRVGTARPGHRCTPDRSKLRAAPVRLPDQREFRHGN